MQSETGFPSSHQLKSYIASKSRLKLATRAVLSADAGLLVIYHLLRNPAISHTNERRKLGQFCCRVNTHTAEMNLRTFFVTFD